VDYIQNILIGKNPFIKEEEEEEAKEVLKGLVEEVRALREVAPIKETYVKRLKKNLPPSSSSLPSLLPPSTPSSFSRSSTSTRSKKKQL